MRDEAVKVRVREENKAAEKAGLIVWKYAIDEELEKFAKEDADKAEHIKYLGIVFNL